MFRSNIWLLALVFGVATSVSAGSLDVRVSAAGDPLSEAAVSVWGASATAPELLATGNTSQTGEVKLDIANNYKFIYVTANKGKTTLLSAIGSLTSGSVTVNELTTVSSTFTHAQFISGNKISGPDVSLAIASGHAPHITDPVTGTWGATLLNGENSTESETLSRLNSLGNLIALCSKSGYGEHCEKFLKAAGDADDTLEAVIHIAKNTWKDPHVLFDIHDKAYVAPKSKNFQERKAGVTFTPYLLWSPKDWSMQIRLSGGGVYALGRIVFDKYGRMWSGANWMPGAQDGAIRGIGGGLANYDVDGTPLSPPVSGYTGMGIDGVGWGTAIIDEKIWLTSFNSTIGVFDFDGKPLGPKEGVTLDGKVGEGQGIAADMNGDVWVASASKNQLIKFPKGDWNNGTIYDLGGKLDGPFSITATRDNMIYVSNSTSPFLTRFPADDPSKAENILVGISVRGLDIDTEGNIWVTSLMALDFPPPEFPPGELPILKEFEVAYNNLAINSNRLPTGQVTLIRPNGEKTDFIGANREVNVPWGLNLDGQNNVIVGGFLGRSVVYMCGATGNCPEGFEPGDVIHNYTSGIIQSLTDAAIDQAGNVWAANNWNVLSAVTQRDPVRENSTKGGGSGVTVIYGIASPISWPRQGPVKPLQ